MKKALIAMSGGVDSSIAAKLTMDMGYECIGCTMRLCGENENADADAQDARAVADRLGIEHCVLDLTQDFREKVIGNFIECYRSGITPNPCVVCNRYIKFGKLFERAQSLGCDRIVTGHYARIEERDGLYILKKAADETKDQSYVLYSMTQRLLAHTLFPLGGMRKADARRIAGECGFANAHKSDSQDICFIPDGDYAGFLARHTDAGLSEGDFIGANGETLGRHRGIARYTIGQRKGLGLSFPEPMYVKQIDARRNTVTLAPDRELYSEQALVRDFNWISGRTPTGEVRCKAKIRYRHAEQWAVAVPEGEGRVRLVFDRPQRAVTPGQSAVLYDGETVLGGGVIIAAP